MTPCKRLRNKGREAGQIIIMTAILLPVLTGLGAMGVDISYLYGQRQESKLAADAAAEAGAIALAKSQSTAQINSISSAYAAANGFCEGGGPLTCGGPNPPSNATIQVIPNPTYDPQRPLCSGPGFVEVDISVPAPLFLGGILSAGGFSTQVRSVAKANADNNCIDNLTLGTTYLCD